MQYELEERINNSTNSSVKNNFKKGFKDSLQNRLKSKIKNIIRWVFEDKKIVIHLFCDFCCICIFKNNKLVSKEYYVDIPEKYLSVFNVSIIIHESHIDYLKLNLSNVPFFDRKLYLKNKIKSNFIFSLYQKKRILYGATKISTYQELSIKSLKMIGYIGIFANDWIKQALNITKSQEGLYVISFFCEKRKINVWEMFFIENNNIEIYRYGTFSFLREITNEIEETLRFLKGGGLNAKNIFFMGQQELIMSEIKIKNIKKCLNYCELVPHLSIRYMFNCDLIKKTPIVIEIVNILLKSVLVANCLCIISSVPYLRYKFIPDIIQEQKIDYKKISKQIELYHFFSKIDYNFDFYGMIDCFKSLRDFNLYADKILYSKNHKSNDISISFVTNAKTAKTIRNKFSNYVKKETKAWRKNSNVEIQNTKDRIIVNLKVN